MLRSGLNVEHHVLPGLYVSFVYNQGGALVKWFRNTFAAADRKLLPEGADLYEALGREMPDEPTRLFVYSNMPQHRDGSSKVPSGGNHVFIDGSARWVRFKNMYALHSWSWGGRLAYFYQDPATFPVGFVPEAAKP